MNDDGIPVARRADLASGALLAVFLGGVAGGLTRYGLTQAWPSAEDRFPWLILGINTAGAFALVTLVVSMTGMRSPPRYLRPLLGTGFLGAFTTFASVVVAGEQLATHGHVGTAASYLSATAAAGLAAGWLGLRLGRSLGSTRRWRAE